MPKIESLDGLKILNSRGEWTIEVRVALDNGDVCSATLPQGVSRGASEAIYLEPEEAIANIKNIISPKLKGLDPAQQEKIDSLMLEADGTANKSKLGGNAILGTSLVVARATAKYSDIPLWQYFQNLLGRKTARAPHLRLFINMIEGGVHSNGNLRFQEYLVIPKTKSFAEATSMGKLLRDALYKFFEHSGGPGATNVGDEGGFAANLKDDLEPFVILSQIADSLNVGQKIDFGLDVAAAQVKDSPKNLLPIYGELINKYKLMYLEDPFGEENFTDFAELLKNYGDKTIIAGDDLTTTNLERIKKAHDEGSINGIIIKPNQIGTLTETLIAIRQAREYGWAVIASHRGGETDDDFIADLAYGVGADGLKLGGPDRGERVAKYNRLLEIERDLSA